MAPQLLETKNEETLAKGMRVFSAVTMGPDGVPVTGVAVCVTRAEAVTLDGQEAQALPMGEVPNAELAMVFANLAAALLNTPGMIVNPND